MACTNEVVNSSQLRDISKVSYKYSSGIFTFHASTCSAHLATRPGRALNERRSRTRDYILVLSIARILIDPLRVGYPSARTGARNGAVAATPAQVVEESYCCGGCCLSLITAKETEKTTPSLHVKKPSTHHYFIIARKRISKPIIFTR